MRLIVVLAFNGRKFAATGRMTSCNGRWSNDSRFDALVLLTDEQDQSITDGRRKKTEQAIPKRTTAETHGRITHRH